MDTALKQRLIGAVVLVALAVIFLPMLIKGPAPDSGVSDVPLDVPATPGGQYETRELPLVTPGNAPDGGVVGLGNGATAAAPATSEAIPLGASAAAADGMLPAATAGGNYAVNFGAYATPADADAVIARLKQSSLPSFREPATVNGRSAYRVRIGPYVERADAEAARLQAAQVRSDVKAQVVTLDAPTTATATTLAPAPAAPSASVAQPAATAAPVATQVLPPEAPKPAATIAAKPAEVAPKPATPTPKPAVVPAKPVEAPKPAAAGVGFAVQLGAFSKASDANAMRDKLRAGGFSAFVEQVKTDKGTLNRVRVGPVASRADADRLKAQVASKVGIDGMVRPHP